MSRKSGKIINETVATQNIFKKNSTPWPEWSDEDLNSEKWERTKETFVTHFEDPQTRILPVPLLAHTWKRPNRIENLKPTIYLLSSTNPNLLINNHHLLHDNFIRWFISSLTILNYCGKNGLEVRNENPRFSWNFRDKPWQGWLNIYSMNKAGKGVEHNPLINTNGKYIVRLFFMGCWRRIEVDDLIPFDNEGKSLLPQTENINELWPILLAKAMLKISCSSQNPAMEITDFNPITALTGWSGLSLNITLLSPNDRWELISKYSYDSKQSEADLVNDLEESNNTSKSQAKIKKRKRSSQINRKLKKRSNNTVMTLLSLQDVENDSKIILNYPMYVESTSDTPSSDPTQIKPPLESWKLHRWQPSTISQGIIDSTDYCIPTRRILFFYPDDGEENPSSDWFDFNELSQCCMDIHLFFKPKNFKCTIDISDIFTDADEFEDKTGESDIKIMRKKSKSRESKEINLQKQLKYLYRAGSKFRNEPLYLFIDSNQPKFLLFDFSVFPGKNKISSLIIEEHCWFGRNHQDKPLLEINTFNTKSKILHLEAGRNLLRIFFQTQSCYHLTISSDKNFNVGDRREIQNLMQDQSERIKIITNSIKNSLTAAFTSFGSDKYAENLKNYYTSYMPVQKAADDEKKFYKLIHDLFTDEIIKVVKKKCPDNYLEVLKIFFLNSMIRTNIHEVDNNDYLFNSGPVSSMVDIGEQYGEDEYNYYNDKLINRSAVIIQSYWRMYKVKYYKKIHSIAHERHKIVKETLNNILNIFNEEILFDLLRNLIKQDKKFLTLYPCSDDFDEILQIQEIKGKITVARPQEWIPVIRININVPEDKTVWARLDLFIDLPVCSLRVFNNDTGCEVQRVVNNVIPYHYQRKTKGFMVFGYGWNDDNSLNELAWTMHLTTVKGDPQFTFFNEQQSIFTPINVSSPKVYEISNIYIPNVFNCVFKVIIRPYSSCFITLRASASHSKVQLKLKLTKEGRQDILVEISGGSAVLLPVIFFDNDEDHWIVEAYVLENSWPLTLNEWKVVKEAKKNSEVSKNILQNPWWRLQVLSEPENHFELSEDTSRIAEMQKFKDSWINNDPDRLERGKIARKKFLDDNLKTDDFIKGENEEIRTLKAPRKLLNISELNFNQFFEKVDEENRRLKTESDEEMDWNEWDRIAMNYKSSRTRFIKQSRHLLHELKLNVALSQKIPTQRNQ